MASISTTTLSNSPPFSTVSSNQTECSIDEEALRLPLAIVYSLIFLLGLVGNLFALWVFLFLHASRNSVRVFLINCAVADLVLLACLPFRIFYHINGNRWILGHMGCKLVGNLFYVNMYISITLLGLISLDRYLRLKGKSTARQGKRIRLWGYSQPWSWVACWVVWGVALLGTVPMIITAEDKEQNNTCFQYKQRRTQAKAKAYFNGVVVMFFWAVFIVLVVSYGKVAAQLLRVSQDKPDLPNAQRYAQTAKKSFFVLFLFTVCFGPYHAFRPIYILSQLTDKISCDYLQLVNGTNEVMLLFSAFNSCLDPVMYFLLSGSVRKTVVRALGHRLGNRFLFLQDSTPLSSTAQFRRPSTAVGVPNSDQSTTATPRASTVLINSTLHRTGATSLSPAGQQ